MRDHRPDEALVLDALMQHFIETVGPAFRDLDSFNARYPVDIPQEMHAGTRQCFINGLPTCTRCQE
jgi:hypothetical protein